MSLISQLEALGQMSHWAVYVALHLPDNPSRDWAHLREALVKELLMRHAPDWATDAAKRDFLLHKLHLPPLWLDQSLAQWARYCQDSSGEFAVCPRHLLPMHTHQFVKSLSSVVSPSATKIEPCVVNFYLSVKLFFPVQHPV